MSSNPPTSNPGPTDLDRATTRDDGPERGGTGPRRPSSTAIVVAVLAMLALVALVVVASQREPVQLSLDTPEGTVQAWLQSVVDDQPAMDLLAPTDCTSPRLGGLRTEGAVRAVVVDTRIDGDRATVELSVTEGGDTSLFDDGWTHDATYELQRTDDGWSITGFDWPWNDCWNDPMNWGDGP